jgi:hypothetical protein
MYVRERICLDQELARKCLKELNVEPVEINISIDHDAAQTLLEIAGALTVPTFVVADDSHRPITPPLPVPEGQRKRDTDRGSIISEPSCEGLRAFLIKHGLIAS